MKRLLLTCLCLGIALPAFAQNAVKKEDNPATSGDYVMPIAAVRVSVCGTPSAGTNGDYIWINVNANGNVCTAKAEDTTGSATDTDDGGIAAGQSSVALVAGLQMYYNGTGWVRVTPSPCSDISLVHTLAISQTTSTKLVSAAASKYTVICAMTVVAGAAEIFNVVEGTGSVCATNIAALAGSTTAANGMSFAANGGVANVAGNGVVIKANNQNYDLCLTQSGSNRLAGFITYAQSTP